MNETKPIKIRCFIIGSSSVGKTTLARRINNSEVDSSYLMTNRIKIHRKSYVQTNSSTPIEVLFIDFPGNELYKDLPIEVFKKLASKCIIVALFDVTNRITITSLESCIHSLTKQPNKTEICGILVANKIDFVDKRIISSVEGQQKAKMFKFRYLECSALNDISLEEFHQLILDMIKTDFVDGSTLPSTKLS